MEARDIAIVLGTLAAVIFLAFFVLLWLAGYGADDSDRDGTDEDADDSPYT